MFIGPFTIIKDFILGKAVVILLVVIIVMMLSLGTMYLLIQSKTAKIEKLKIELKACNDNIEATINSIRYEESQDEITKEYISLLQNRLIALIREYNKRLSLVEDERNSTGNPTDREDRSNPK